MLTFREFYQICEGKKSKKSKGIEPPHAVPGSHKEFPGGGTYTLKPYTGPSGPATEKEIKKNVIDQSGGKAVKKFVKKRQAKIINKIKEDIETRRQELIQKRKEQIAKNKQKVVDYRQKQQEKIQAQRDAEEEKIEKQRERERLKDELRQELTDS